MNASTFSEVYPPIAPLPAGDEGNVLSEPVVFSVTAWPHRSMSPKCFMILMGAVSAVISGMIGVFVIAGAWPVAGFLGMDILLLFIAFRVSFQRGAAYQNLLLTPKYLTVRNVNHCGRQNSWKFPSRWLQVIMDDPPLHNSQLVVRSHGRSLAIANFLSMKERHELANALRKAILSSRFQ